jgi:hypothetical protein
VIKTAIAHREHRVVIRLRFAKLNRAKDSYVMLAGLDTPARSPYHLFVGWRRNGSAEVILEGLGPDAVECPKLRPLLNLNRDLIRIRIPRGCLGSPRWIRANITVSRDAMSNIGTLTDDPMSNRPASPFSGRSTRKLYRG